MNRIATRKDLDRVAAGRTAAAEKRQLRFHVCMGASCIASGATEVLEALEAELAGRNGTVEVSGTGCMGPCVRGPVLRVLPAGDTFTGVRAGDVAEIVARSFGETGPDAPAPDAT
ncbi:MAG: (2Fe-2S) ferredoxin domain-containing protein, partial [Spirochaetota bacterium]